MRITHLEVSVISVCWFIGDMFLYQLAWQSFLVGVMGFAVIFGLMAFVFSIFGLCSGAIPKRLYYYHSGAEMLFVSSILTGAAVIGFPLCIKYKVEIERFSYGPGVYSGIVSTLFYFLAACLLNLDVFIISTVPAKDDKASKRRSHRF